MKRKIRYLIQFVVALGVTAGVSRTAHAIVDCWWSEITCSPKTECRWDDKRSIHHCMPIESPTEASSERPTPPNATPSTTVRLTCGGDEDRIHHGDAITEATPTTPVPTVTATAQTSAPTNATTTPCEVLNVETACYPADFPHIYLPCVREVKHANAACRDRQYACDTAREAEVKACKITGQFMAIERAQTKRCLQAEDATKEACTPRVATTPTAK